jgi:hypothetical protein
MESSYLKRNAEKFKVRKAGGRQTEDSMQQETKKNLSSACYPLSTDKGIALVMAILISLAVMLLVISTLYFICRSTSVSGAGKRYATASEAADGAVEVMKDAINLILMGEPVSSLPIVDAGTPCLADSVVNENLSCTTSLTLPGTDFFADYKANITVMRLYTSTILGSRLEFARAGGVPTTAVYYRINTVVSGPGSTRAETTALYRYVL